MDELPLQYKEKTSLIKYKTHILLILLISCMLCQYSFEQKYIMSRIADSNKASAHILLANKNSNKDIINMVESIPTLDTSVFVDFIFVTTMLLFGLNRYNYIYSQLSIIIRQVSVGPHAPPKSLTT